MLPKTAILTRTSSGYPSILRGVGEEVFPQLWSLGEPAILRCELLGFFCSTRCPGDVILRAYDTARTLREVGIPVIGGFHTPMEQECLDLLLRGTQPIVWCPARGLPNPRRLPAAKRNALADSRLLILSPFDGQEKRMTADLAVQRNDLVAQLAYRLLFLYAPPGSKTEGQCKKAVADGKTVLTLGEEYCTNLMNLGALAVGPADISRSLDRMGGAPFPLPTGSWRVAPDVTSRSNKGTE